MTKSEVPKRKEGESTYDFIVRLREALEAKKITPEQYLDEIDNL